MLTVVAFMVVVLLVAMGVVVYAAFPGRGARLPGPPWLGGAVEQVTDAVPTLDESDADARVAGSGPRRG